METTQHECTTVDGVTISIGLVVFTNDLKPVKITGKPSLYGDEVCDGKGHGTTNLPGNCWWEVETPDGNRGGSFDGSRMVTRYRFNDRGTVAAQDDYIAAGGK